MNNIEGAEVIGVTKEKEQQRYVTLPESLYKRITSYCRSTEHSPRLWVIGRLVEALEQAEAESIRGE